MKTKRMIKVTQKPEFISAINQQKSFIERIACGLLKFREKIFGDCKK